jgi:hypothetical protein
MRRELGFWLFIGIVMAVVFVLRQIGVVQGM